MSLDQIQVLLWLFTYILCIYVCIKYKNEKAISMPLNGGILNISWEIIAFIMYPSYAHIIWLAGDSIIYYFNIRSLTVKKHRILYIFCTFLCVVVLCFLFSLHNGMLITVFLIDLLLEMSYFLNAKKLSSHLRVSIGVTKLFGDAVAWLTYKDYSIIVNIIGVIVLLINFVYVLYVSELYQDEYKTRKKYI